MTQIRLRSAVFMLALALASAAIRASVVPPLEFAEIVRTADVVFRGEVLRTESRFVETPSGRAIITAVTFRVERALKGSVPAELSLEFLGGQVRDVRLDVAGVPRFTVGQRDIVCIRVRERQVSPVIGFNQGRFRVSRDAAGRDHVTTHDGWAFSSVRALGRRRPLTTAAPVQAMTLDAFEAEILRGVAG